MGDVAKAVAAVKRDLIGELPKMRRAGQTDVSDLKVGEQFAFESEIRIWKIDLGGGEALTTFSFRGIQKCQDAREGVVVYESSNCDPGLGQAFRELIRPELAIGIH